LGRVFSSKFARLVSNAWQVDTIHTASSRVENSAQVLACWLKCVHAKGNLHWDRCSGRAEEFRKKDPGFAP